MDIPAIKTLSAAGEETSTFTVSGDIAVRVQQSGYHELLLMIKDQDGDWARLRALQSTGIHHISTPATAKGRHTLKFLIPTGGYISGSSTVEVF